MSTTPSPWSPDLRSLTVTLVLLELLWVSEGLVAGVTLPVAATALGGLSAYGWAFSGATVARLTAILAVGIWGGRIRPVVILWAGLGTAAGGLAVISLAPSMAVLVAGRVAVGLGLGTLAALTFQLLALSYGPEVRERVILAFAAACVIPAMVLPPAAGWLAETVGWRWVVIAVAALVAGGAPGAARALSGLEPGGEAAGAALRIREAGRLVAGSLLILVGAGMGSPVPFVTLVAAGVCLLAPPLIRSVRRAGDPRRTGLALAVLGMAFFGLFGLEPFVLLGLVAVRGEAAWAAGLLLVPSSLAWVAGAWVNARWGSLVPRRTMISWGLGTLLAGVTLMALPVVWALPAPVAVATTGRALAGAGLGLAFSAGVLLAVEGAFAGVGAMVMVRSVTTLGPALGTGLAGAVVARAGAAGWPLERSLGLVAAMTGAVLVGAWVTAGRLGVQHPEQRTARLVGWWAGYRGAWMPGAVRRSSVGADPRPSPRGLRRPPGVPLGAVTRPPWLR